MQGMGCRSGFPHLQDFSVERKVRTLLGSPGRTRETESLCKNRPGSSWSCLTTELRDTAGSLSPTQGNGVPHISKATEGLCTLQRTDLNGPQTPSNTLQSLWLLGGDGQQRGRKDRKETSQQGRHSALQVRTLLPQGRAQIRRLQPPGEGPGTHITLRNFSTCSPIKTTHGQARKALSSSVPFQTGLSAARLTRLQSQFLLPSA
uniref:uncharacterized protein LOC118154755 n=1 Tax=Callithrix jacchus TaxID=9483 RepID=UPI0023DD14A2|nr:uncharacterized protein LOC118154755 [Callithrix jacchus]